MQLNRRTLLASTTKGFASALLLTPMAKLYAGTDFQYRGPVFGVQTYSFRDMLPAEGDTVDKMIAGCRALGIHAVELFEPSIQPPEFSANAPWAFIDGKPTRASVYGKPPEGPPPKDTQIIREKIRQWRLATPLDYFYEIGDRFRRAGIQVQAFNFSLKMDCTDEEAEKGFLITKALGTSIMTTSTTVEMAERSVAMMEHFGVLVGLHGHSNLHDPNQFARPESFERALELSPLYGMNFDVGHFHAAGFDSVAFLKKHHNRILNVHLKDRKNDFGKNMPFGKGDTPIAEIVQTIVKNRYPIPMMYEYEYAGSDSITELKKMSAYCLDAAQKALTS
ncbi:sugar phosphate isomerase/epimerase family protein [Halioxenophilus aromaticivorans]|uniref:Xylose isomerase-like TIM barrel domain-containing protein n=1 Tax=Halioxenophilus aromaticivorans TaxID=1306992 RepID=A0AAV3TYL2_9ALTE